MRLFIEKQQSPPQTTSTNRAPIKQSHNESSILHLQRSIGNQAVQRTLRKNTEHEKLGSNSAFSCVADDFGKIPAVPQDRAKANTSSGNNRDRRSIVMQFRHPFLAMIPRVSPAFQSDSMSADEQESAMDVDFQAARTFVSPLAGSITEPLDSETVHFPAEILQSAAITGQSDSISSTFEYKSSINQIAAPSSPGQFGKTQAYFQFEKPGPSAIKEDNTFKVTGTIEAKIEYWVDGGGRTDITSDSDPAITQRNYQTIVKDLTPSPNAVNSGGQNLYKNQPPRTKFWAEDLTIKHEAFHADENKLFGQQGLTIAQNWLNGQTAKSYDDVGGLLNQVNPKIAKKVDTEMALPDRELRAYADGAPDYLARAQAVKRKGDAKGYTSKRKVPRRPKPESG